MVDMKVTEILFHALGCTRARRRAGAASPRPLPGCYSDRLIRHACIHEDWAGFFEVVCTPSTITANFRDPPPPRNTKGPEPWLWGSGLKRITRRATVGGALAWGRGRPPPAHCQSTTRKSPTTLHIVDTPLEASRAGALLVGTPSCSSHDLMP